VAVLISIGAIIVRVLNVIVITGLIWWIYWIFRLRWCGVLTITILVDTITRDVHFLRSDREIAVITVTITGTEAIPIQVISISNHTVAVRVEAVTQFLCSRIDRVQRIVAVPPARTPAVTVGIEALIDFRIAVIIQAIT